jgi:hypothetical protein
MPVKLWRAQLGEAAGLDVSRKSGGYLGLRFAPTWDLIMPAKRGQILWPEFRSRYKAQLSSRVTAEDAAELHRYGLDRGGTLCLLCYCKAGKNCHTLALIEWLVENYPELFEVKVR